MLPQNNLILIHSFGTNSTMLKGVADFLKRFVNVYFIDLPGFNINNKALKHISIDNYTKFVESKIRELNLEHYFIGGISFGFIIANNCKVDSKCKGIWAIEPYLNIDSIKIHLFLKILMRIIVTIIIKFNLHKRVYHSKIFKKTALIKNPEHRIDKMLKTVDGYTFFETANIILNYHEKPKFHNKKYILILNEDDGILKTDKIITEFQKIDKLIIIKTTAKHYPEYPTKEYFEKHIKENNIKKAMQFLDIKYK